MSITGTQAFLTDIQTWKQTLALPLPLALSLFVALAVNSKC